MVLVDREEGGREEIVKYISSVEALFTKTELMEAYRKARGVLGCRKTPICCVALILRHCDVLKSTPHSS